MEYLKYWQLLGNDSEVPFTSVFDKSPDVNTFERREMLNQHQQIWHILVLSELGWLLFAFHFCLWEKSWCQCFWEERGATKEKNFQGSLISPPTFQRGDCFCWEYWGHWARSKLLYPYPSIVNWLENRNDLWKMYSVCCFWGIRQILICCLCLLYDVTTIFWLMHSKIHMVKENIWIKQIRKL